jgi:DedD protein
MDQELKQRLIGAAVVTALAAIFIPMLFDDPIDDSGKAVSEMSVPQTPAVTAEAPASKLPASAGEVTSQPAEAETQDAAREPEPQASDNGEPEVVVTEDTGQPVDDQQWVEEKTVETEPEPAAEAVSPPVPEETEAVESPAPATPTKHKQAAPSPSSISESLERQAKPAPIKSATAPVASPVKKSAAAPKTEASKAGKGLSRWYIQAGSFGKKENALARLEDLQKQGLPVLMETQNTDKGTLYRLKVGPQLDKKRAIEIKNRLNKQNIKSIIIAE